jgi:DNA-binding transcriptional ArsR family regulator
MSPMKRDDDDADALDAVWKALASPIRRRILDLLSAGPLTTGDLALEFADHSRFAIMQHLRVLEEAELLLVRRDGRRRFNYFNRAPIQMIYDRWVDRHVQPWTEALVDLRDELESSSKSRRRRA